MLSSYSCIFKVRHQNQINLVSMDAYHVNKSTPEFPKRFKVHEENVLEFKAKSRLSRHVKIGGIPPTISIVISNSHTSFYYHV